MLEPEELPPTCLPRVFSGKEKEVGPKQIIKEDYAGSAAKVEHRL